MTAAGLLLLRLTLAVVLVAHGWIAELLPASSKLRMDAPVARERGQPITGRIRLEMAPSAPATRLNATHVSWSGAQNSFAGHGNYEPAKLGFAEATLTERLREKDERVPIPREKWSIETRWTGAERESGVNRIAPPTSSAVQIKLKTFPTFRMRGSSLAAPTAGAQKS